MSSPGDARGGLHARQETLAWFDGSDRIPFLPLASYVAFAPGSAPDEPPFAWIIWRPGVIERPLPGSALWRRILQQFLERPDPLGAAEQSLRAVVAESLERFPTLESWIRWDAGG